MAGTATTTGAVGTATTVTTVGTAITAITVVQVITVDLVGPVGPVGTVGPVGPVGPVIMAAVTADRESDVITAPCRRGSAGRGYVGKLAATNAAPTMFFASLNWVALQP
jgi:hypothetical protein